MDALYRPLQSECNEVRRLLLAPGAFHDSLTGQLETVSIDDEPDFEALSYVWGEKTDLKLLYLSGHSVSITVNLDIALRHIRYESTPRVLWVDALFIRQDDPDQRASQVSMMGRIFGAESMVLIWLGPAAEDGSSDIAMQSIERTGVDYWLTYDFNLQFIEILYRPWFTRVWVVQEFALANQIAKDVRKGSPKFGCETVWVDCWDFMSAWSTFSDSIVTFATRARERLEEVVSATSESEWTAELDRPHLIADDVDLEQYSQVSGAFYANLSCETYHFQVIPTFFRTSPSIQQCGELN